MMEKTFPKVSIMIPTYNQERFIAQAIESALMQDYPALEVIVADDGSTDRTGEIAASYDDPRLKYIRNPHNLGRVGNYHNTLYEHASGEWVVNLDGDDYYTDPRFVSRSIDYMLRLCEQGYNPVICLSNYQRIRTMEKRFGAKKLDDRTVVMPGRTYFLNYAELRGFSHGGCLYRRDKACEIGFYTSPFQASDFQSVLRLTLFGDVVLHDSVPYVWRKHTDNTTFVEVDRKFGDGLRVFLEIEKFARNYLPPFELNLWLKHMCDDSWWDQIETWAYTRRSHQEKRKALLLMLRFGRPYSRHLRQIPRFMKHLLLEKTN